MYSDKEKLTSANITDIMQTAYIDYSMSVIVSRALPDARDGLKPVQRRILYAMLREGLVHNRPFDKCAGVVGEVLKNYHPHGDSSVYDTLVRLAQNWVMRYQLIEPQGNFGSVDGDPPAAPLHGVPSLRSLGRTPRRHRRGHRRLHSELQGVDHRADRPAVCLAAPVDERFDRYRGRHDDQHPAA